MAKKPLPTQETLRQLLDYDPQTGALTWKPRTGKWSSRWNKRYAGKIAGKSIHLGHFSDFNEAVEARRIAENKMGFTGRL